MHYKAEQELETCCSYDLVFFPSENAERCHVSTAQVVANERLMEQCDNKCNVIIQALSCWHANTRGKKKL